MTTTKDASPPLAAPTRGWVKILLAVSLALNLGVAGLAAGAWFRDEAAGSTGSRRDMGLGPLASAMTREDWRAMRPAFMALNPDLGRGVAALHEDYAPLLAALRDEQFEPAALHAALAQILARNSHRLVAAREVIGGYLLTLAPEARLDYAARLEQTLDHLKTRHAPKKAP